MSDDLINVFHYTYGLGISQILIMLMLFFIIYSSFFEHYQHINSNSYLSLNMVNIWGLGLGIKFNLSLKIPV